MTLHKLANGNEASHQVQAGHQLFFYIFHLPVFLSLVETQTYTHKSINLYFIISLVPSIAVIHLPCSNLVSLTLFPFLTSLDSHKVADWGATA